MRQTRMWINGAAGDQVAEWRRLWPSWPGRWFPQNAWLAQAARYSTVGVFNTALDAALYLLLTHWFGLAGLKILAKGISYSAGTVNSFHWNRAWTFRSKGSSKTPFLLFVLASLVAIGLNSAVMWFGLGLFRQNDTAALALATLITLAFNFTASKFIVFKERGKP